MSDNLNFEVIEEKLNNVTELIEQQGKSGVFFDSFTKQILEKIHLKLEDISNFETTELISYLTGELKKELEERHTYIEQRLTGVQGQLQVVQSNLAESIKTPEVAQVFSQLSDNLMAFSRDLGTQTRYFNNAIAEVQNMVNQNNFDQKLSEQTNNLKADLSANKNSLENGLVDMQEGFQKLYKSIEGNAPFEALNALDSEISVLQSSLTNLVAAVSGINNKQASIIEEFAKIISKEDFVPTKEEISSILAQTLALGESLKFLASKTDLKSLEEKLTYTVEMVANIKDVANLSNDEHKNLLNAYFTNLYNLVSTLMTKEDNSQMKENLSALKLAIETSSDNFDETFSVTQNDIKTIIPMLSSLSTQDNLKELSQYAINGLEKLNNDFIASLNSSKQFTEEKIDELKGNLSSIYNSLGEFSTTLDNLKSENTSYMRVELTRVYDLLDDFKEKLSYINKESFETISGNLRDNSVIIVDKIEALETALNSSQDVLEGNLSGNISQLKEFSQSIVNSLQEIISTAEDNRMGVQNALGKNHTALLARVDELEEKYSATSLDNKSEIISQISTLKELIEVSQTLLEDKSGFDMVSEKVQNIETILDNYKQAVLMSDNQLHQAFVEQNEVFASVKDNIQSLAFKLANLNDTALENKSELTNLITDKFTLLNGSLNSVYDGLKINSGENKSALAEEISKIAKETDEIKTLISETAENQATKQVLGIIFESITKKLSEVSTIFDDSKAYSLEVYDGLKGLITGLKEELSNVSQLVDRSDAFATDVKNNIDSTLGQVSIDTVQKIEKLKDYLKEISSENKSELISQIENIGEKLLSVENTMEELKLDELIKEELSQLKSQIENFNAKSLQSLLETISTDNAQTSETIRETVLGLGANFDDVLFKIGKIEEKSFDTNAELDAKLSENFETLNEKVSIVASNLQNNSYQNKDEIVAEINNLKSSLATIKESIHSVGNKILNDEYFNAQVDKITEELNAISEKTHAQVDLSFKNSCDGIIEGIKNAFEIIQEDIEEAIANLKTSNGSLEERLGEIKNKVSYEIDEIKALVEENSSSFDTSSQEIKSHLSSGFEAVGDRLLTIGSNQSSAKTEIISEFSSSIENIADKLELSENKREESKGEILSEITKSFQSLNQRMESVSGTNAELREETKNEILSEITKSFQSMNQRMESASGTDAEFREEIKFEFKKSIDEISERLFRAGDDNLNLKSELIAELQKSYGAISAKLSEGNENSSENHAEIKTTLEEQFKLTSESLEDKFATLNTLTEYLNSDIKSEIRVEAQKLLNDVKKSLGAVEESVLLKLNEDKLSGLRAEINDHFELVMEKMAENSSTEDLEEKFSEFEASIKSLDNKDEIKSMLDTFISKILSQDNSSVIKAELETFAETISEKIENVSITAEKNKSDLSEKIEAISLKVSEKLDGTADEIIDTITKEIEQGFGKSTSDIAQAVEDKISYLKDDIGDVVLKISQLDGLSDSLKNTLLDELDEYRTDINAGLSALSEDVKKYLLDNGSELKETLEAIQNNGEELGENIKEVQNDTNSIKEILKKYQQSLESLSDIDLSVYQSDTKKFINQEIDSLKQDFEQKLTKFFETDETQIIQEELKTTSDSIKTEIAGLKETILSLSPEKSDWEEKLAEKFEQAQKEITSSINALQGNSQEIIDAIQNKNEEVINSIQGKNQDIIDAVQGNNKEIINTVQGKNKEIIDTVKSETTSIKDVIAKYQKEIENISDIDFSSFQNESQDFVKKELKQLKEQFVINLASVFENISFIEEAQEIQDVIYDNADEIKEEINKLKQAVISNSNAPVDIDEKFEKLKDLLSASIKKDIKVLTTSSDNSSEYLYTLPDIEVDLAKMRLAINDMSNIFKNSKEDEIDYSLDLNEKLVAIDEIRDDISSISKRTNKLILTSEDANKNLKEHLEDLKAITNHLTQKCEMLDNTEIERNVKDVKSLVMSTLKSDKVLNEAFMFLAEWIDGTAVSINKIDTNVLELKRDTKLVDEISDVKEILTELMRKVPEHSQDSSQLTEVENKLDEIVDRFDEQEKRLKAIEKKIESTKKPSGDEGEIHSVLEFIASQVSAANENSRGNKLLIEKMERMEQKINRLETNIGKLTSLIDEE